MIHTIKNNGGNLEDYAGKLKEILTPANFMTEYQALEVLQDAQRYVETGLPSGYVAYSKVQSEWRVVQPTHDVGTTQNDPGVF